MATNVFEDGDIDVVPVPIHTSPKPSLVFSPTVAGSYPVIVFFHGFFILNTSYNKLLRHIASHGYIVVAPKLLSGIIPMDGPSEVKFAAEIVNWIAEGLQPCLPDNVEAQLESLVLAGHSRGGKTAFAVALGKCDVQINLKIKVLLGIDPAEGRNKMLIKPPHVLTYKPESLNLGMPVLVIGTGLGPEKSSFFSMPCAPDGVNHEEYYRECKAPCAHFVIQDYGHMDMLDEGVMTPKCFCKNGKGPKDLMRNTISGLVVAFLRAHLKGQFEDLDIIVKDPDLAPTKLDEVDYQPKLDQKEEKVLCQKQEEKVEYVPE
ncbi:hypothetical protein PIB30_091961 [Stylosanthes scabra]|uniref:Chlorophyllase n=1 Tax=Stylosanthes scabra TaxID=79078 RepID=A0ABU6RUM7_9FABA|nr:hypothetical protein [Stylosanthes scabra]